MAKQLRRVRTLGRGASGAVVWLASDEESGELMAVKSACASGAAQLRHERRVLSGLCSPHIVPCLGSRAAEDGEYHLFLEFAPGGSLADEAARIGGQLPEPALRAYAGDVARGLAYLHGKSLVHGDVKARNVVIGGDGRARLTDFGCARAIDSVGPIGGTPAFMAPEVARGEEQGPAADVWALGCTIIEMATGRAPWRDMDDILAAVHRIGFTDAVPEVPEGLSAEAKDFLDVCFKRKTTERSTAAQLLEHPFIASATAAALDRGCGTEQSKQDRTSPKSTLQEAFYDSDSDDEADETPIDAVKRIESLSCAASALPDWDSDEGWIEVHDEGSFVPITPPASDADDFVRAEEASYPVFDSFAVATEGHGGNHLPRNAVQAIDSSIRQGTCMLMHLFISKNENLHPFDIDRTEPGRLNCVCTMNRVIKNEISLRFAQTFGAFNSS
ncbi:hypothetical protein GUJ93_ZPchr0007g4161 [Zizania palustris]|uniref:Protein kinase domain-containing protein n=1 Tax=Zizania palustris TaxID=103762 RepID=A0A8J5VR72_ZIZPA|nr:hypothetical protein GUJ93_ZPchr0007g4161 [Zizania palustris]